MRKSGSWWAMLVSLIHKRRNPPITPGGDRFLLTETGDPLTTEAGDELELE